MPRNGSGSYSLPAGNPVTSGTLIEASWANTTLSDLASAMTDSLARSGEGGMTGPLRATDGSVSVPSLSFGNETSTGFYRAGATDVRFAMAGVDVATVTTAGVTVGSTKVLALPDGTAAAPALTNTGDTNTGVYFPAEDTVGVSTGGTERVRIDSSGNLGLGVTPSAWGSSFKVIQAGSGAAVAGSNLTSQSLVLANAYSDAGGLKYINTAQASYYQQYLGAHAWFTAPSGTAGNAISFTQAMTLDASGNLLVGTTTSSGTSGRLHVAGTSVGGEVSARIENLDSSNAVSEAGLRFMFDGTLKGYVGTIYGSGGASTMYFYNNGAERARITSGGDFLIAKPSGNINNVGWEFNAAGTGQQTFDIAGANEAFIYNNTSTSGTAKVDFRVANSSKGSITWTNSATSFNTSSDYRLKENIQPMTGALAKVAQLKPCTYTWKVDGSAGQGFIAHELAEVVPDAVTGEKDAVNEDGSIKSQGIDTSFLVATLTAAIKEQQAIITQLTARIEALEAAA